MIWSTSSWDIEQNRLKLAILGHFLPFIPLNTPKIKILKNEKICWRYHHFTHVHQKLQSYDVRFLRYRVRQTKSFCHYGPIFALLPPPVMIPNIKILKKTKKKPGDIILLYIHVYHKWRSYDIWFLKYNRQTDRNFWHFGPFFALSAAWQPGKSKS